MRNKKIFMLYRLYRFGLVQIEIKMKIGFSFVFTRDFFSPMNNMHIETV